MLKAYEHERSQHSDTRGQSSTVLIRLLQQSGKQTTGTCNGLHLVRAGWNTQLIDECEVFPYGAHDDQVDATAGAFNELANVSNVWDW